MTTQEHCQAFYDWLKLRRVNMHRNGIVLAMFLWSQKRGNTTSAAAKYRTDKVHISPLTLFEFLNKPQLASLECYPGIGPKHAEKLNHMRPNELETMYKSFGCSKQSRDVAFRRYLKHKDVKTSVNDVVYSPCCCAHMRA